MIQSKLLSNGVSYGTHTVSQVGDMFVHDCHLVGKRMLEIIRFFNGLLSGHGTYNIVFRVDKPEGQIDGRPLLGVCHYDTLSIGINIESIFGDSIFKVMEEKTSCINIVHLFWSDIMQCVAHEMIHMYHDNNCMPQLSEDEIDTQSLKMCISAAKEICVEPDFSGMCADLLRDFVASFQDGTSNWAKSQQQLVITEKAYAKNGRSFPYLRDVLRHCKYGNPDDLAWGRQFVEITPQSTPTTHEVPPIAQATQETDISERYSEGYDDDMGMMEATCGESHDYHDPEEYMGAPVAVAEVVKGTYPSNGLSNSEITSIMNRVFARVHYHLFTKCGWNANTGVNHNGFTSIANVTEGIYVGDIANVDKVFISCSGINQVGVASDMKITDRIYGGFTHKGALPRYTLYVNKNTGVIVRYTMIPQNKNKCKPAGGPSAWASKALAGYWISMILNDKEKDERTGKAKMVCMIETTPEMVTTIGTPFSEKRKVI